MPNKDVVGVTLVRGDSMRRYTQEIDGEEEPQIPHSLLLGTVTLEPRGSADNVEDKSES